MRPTRRTVHTLPALPLLFALACTPPALEGEDTPDSGEGGGDVGAQVDSGGGGGGEDAGGGADAGGGGSLNPFEGDAAEATAGKAVYDANGCGNCHGADGRSTTFKDLGVSATDTEDQVLFDAIQIGVPNTAMVAYGSAIDDDDIWRIVTWIRTIE